MKLVGILTLSAGLGAAALAQPISEAERAKAVEYLRQTEARLLKVVGGLSSEQWRYKSAPERWSIAECVEHITVTEQRILGGIQQSLAAPATPEKFSKDRDGVVLRFMPDRSRTAQAPQEIRPTGRPEFTTPASAAAAFRAVRAKSIEFTQMTQGDLRGHGFTHMAFGDLDDYQWALLIAGHCERHTKQAEEVMAATGYPK